MPKNVLYLNCTSDLYGASKVAVESVKALKKAGYTVTFAISHMGPLFHEITALGCRVEIIPLATIRRKYFTPLGLINRAFAWRKSWVELSRIVRDNDTDLIISNTTAILIGVFFSRRKSIKHVWHVHEIKVGPPWLQRIYAGLMSRKTDLVIGVSDAVQRHWTSMNSKIRMVRIYNGFDYSIFQNAKSSLRSELNLDGDINLIGMIARVHFWKGQDYFLEIANRLNRKLDNVHFVMVGDAYQGYEYLYDTLKKKTSDLQLEECVHNLGFRSDIGNIMKGLDLFVLPSILPDPLPTTVLEAMVCGVPVAATAHGGACEMVDEGNTGILIPWDDADDACERIFRLMMDSLRRDQMSISGKDRVLSLYSVESFEKNLISTLEAL